MSVSSLPFLHGALAAVLPKLAAWRRDFHAHPEAGWTEFRTAALIIRRLRELGYAIRMGEAACASDRRMGVPSSAVLAAARERALEHGADAELVAGMGDGYTGFWADLDCGPGPVTAFRFDMDCNEVAECAEESHRPVREGFASRWPGLMHACGHDGHAAVGLGLAEVLVSIRRHLRGRIRLIFQPAEEGARGALPMSEAGAVDGVDVLFGFHIGFKAEGPGTLICGTQGFLATTKRDVLFSGVPAHAGAAPEEGKDALLAACSAVVNLHAISRNGKGGTRIAVGRLEGGEARNVIPASARLFMETRGETTELDAYMVAESERILRASAELWGCACEWRTVGNSAGGESSPELARLIATVAEVMGGWKTVIPMSGFGATEDFACLMSRVQASGGLASCLQVGTDRAAGHHSDRFDFDETCLGRALELLARLAVRMAGGGQEDTETQTENDMEFLDEVVRRKGIHVQLWLEGEDGEGFGRGRVELLQLVDELGSLSKAAKQLGMSYRGAWGKIKKAERIAGETLVDASGTKRDGYSLTPAGRELVQRFQQWYADVESFANKRAEALFSDFDKE